MADFKRANRVAKLMKQEISQIISRELKDPRVVMATVTKVKLTDNLSFARIFVSIMGDEKVKQNTLEGLNVAKNFIRTELGHRTGLKFVPDISFYYDDSIDYAQNIESLIKKIHDDER